MLDFEITPKITKDFLLSKFSQETIFCHYLGITHITKKLIKNQTRNDKNPTCGFYKNSSGVLILHDFASGEYFNCFSYVMKLFHCSYHKALDIIASDFGILKKDNKPTPIIKEVPIFKEKEKSTYIQVELGSFTEQDLKWWRSFGITEKTLNKFRVFPCKSVFLNGNLVSQRAQHNPIYGYYFGKKDGIEQWRIYFPQRKEMKFMGNVPTKTIQGFKQLPKTGKLLIITKSMKDSMCFHELGIPACAPNSENAFVSDSVLENLKARFKHIIVFYDNDIPGIHNMRKIKAAHPELTYFYIPRKYEAKDFSDFYKKYGRQETLATINKELKKYKESLKND
jgi:hypothetical protein